MSSNSPNSQNPDPKTLENQNTDPNSTPNQNPEISDQPTNPNETGQNQTSDENREEGEEEEEGECGFCLFMKGGGCKDAFISWENCVEEAEQNKEDIVEKCFEIILSITPYELILRAEKAADEEVKQELEREARKTEDEANSESKGIEETVEIEVEKQN
ncbi:hypothetical protein RND81_03G197200 [Saponaria officinalis]|uniref:GCK domain-containing protein n=1 Tax=Saponaria officinalis TaxID=3572 RepID=A0AAW1M9U6_SAPOF